MPRYKGLLSGHNADCVEIAGGMRDRLLDRLNKMSYGSYLNSFAPWNLASKDAGVEAPTADVDDDWLAFDRQFGRWLPAVVQQVRYASRPQVVSYFEAVFGATDTCQNPEDA